jgi:hypothetical protein
VKLGDAVLARSESPSLSMDEWLAYFKLGGNPFTLFGSQPAVLGSKQEEIQHTFQGYVQAAYKANGIVFACMLARQALFSEARFQYRRRVLGRPGQMFGTSALQPLEEPWPGGTTSDLLARVIQDVDLGGNFFAARRPGNKIKRLRPDWVTIILGSNKDPEVGFGDVDADVLGYIYQPGGYGSEKQSQPFLANEVAHFAPIPDPISAFRGMSWLTPVLREIEADSATTLHKLKYFENGAVPSAVVTFDANVQRDALEAFLERFKEENEGVQNAYRTLILAQGAKAEVVGSNLKDIDFQAVQGAGENRITVAAGVPAIIAGLSEGLRAATLANYAEARRHFADATIRPLWRGICGSLSTIIEVPPGTELWYDDRDISYLQADRKDEAEIQFKESEAIKRLVEAGYEPGSVIDAITSNDMTRLSHTGLVSVQLLPPGTEHKTPALPAPSGE